MQMQTNHVRAKAPDYNPDKISLRFCWYSFSLIAP